MSILGMKARNHPLQVAARGVLDDVDDRSTEGSFWEPLDRRFAFTVDVAAASHNAKCPRFYDRETDGLARSWAGERVWCNPPYSRIRPWVEKAWAEFRTAELVVLLVPANRTEQDWWHDLVEPYRDRAGSPLRAEFVRGRVRFLLPDEPVARGHNRPLFGCCLLIWQWAPEVPLTLFRTDGGDS